MRDDAVVGCTGALTIAIEGPKDPGEVHVSVRGGSESFLAYADEPLAVGRTVLVIDTRGARAVDVVPWDEGYPPARPR